jgi:hypothetical protein
VVNIGLKILPDTYLRCVYHHLTNVYIFCAKNCNKLDQITVQFFLVPVYFSCSLSANNLDQVTIYNFYASIRHNSYFCQCKSNELDQTSTVFTFLFQCPVTLRDEVGVLSATFRQIFNYYIYSHQCRHSHKTFKWP